MAFADPGKWDPEQAPARPGVAAYDRASVDAYFAAATRERARLCEQLAAAQARVARARSALDAPRVVEAMLDRTLDDIASSRRRSELGEAVAGPDEGVSR